MTQQPPSSPGFHDDDYSDDEDLYDEYEEFDEADVADSQGGVTYRGATSDPVFGLVLAGAVSIGLIPLIGSDAMDMRYTLTWGMLAVFGVLSWLMGSSARIDQETPENLAWGVVFGIILGIPLLAFGGSTLQQVADLLFRDMTAGALLAYLVFVMPLAETLFFRGVLQEVRSFWSTGIICTIWQLVLFFPLMNQGPYPLIVGVVLLMANTMYSYVRERNGLAAAWLCQIVVNLLLLFIPFAGL